MSLPCPAIRGIPSTAGIQKKLIVLGVEPRSFIAISAAFGALWAFIFFVLHASFPREIKGLARWAWACAMMAAAAVLFALHGTLPVVLSSFLPNLLVAAGVAAMHGSVRQFGDMRSRDVPLCVLLALTALALAPVTFGEDNYRGRLMVMSSALAILFGSCAYAIRGFEQKSFAERYTGIVFAATSVIMLLRCLLAFSLPPSITREVVDASPIHHLYLATFSFSIVALSVGFLLMVNRKLHRKLEALAMRDKQTGVYRRDAFLALLDREIAESKSRQRPIAVLMIDIDDFKGLNDRHGQLAGDRVLDDFSVKARQALRRHDALGRYGSDEFLALVTDASTADAKVVAERIRNAIAQKRREDIPAYTVSVGIARLETGREDAGAIIEAADKALQAARSAGQNHVAVAAGPQL